ncbi:MAG: hypothetical protein WC707_04240 [Candidatus Babeliaceae bacterium]|jgi:hypothetical protein
MKKLLSLLLMGSMLVPHGAQAAWYDWNESGKLIAIAASYVGVFAVGGLWVNSYKNREIRELNQNNTTADTNKNQQIVALTSHNAELLDVVNNYTGADVKISLQANGMFYGYQDPETKAVHKLDDFKIRVKKQREEEVKAQKKQIAAAVSIVYKEKKKLVANVGAEKKRADVVEAQLEATAARETYLASILEHFLPLRLERRHFEDNGKVDHYAVVMSKDQYEPLTHYATKYVNDTKKYMVLGKAFINNNHTMYLSLSSAQSIGGVLSKNGYTNSSGGFGQIVKDPLVRFDFTESAYRSK